MFEGIISITIALIPVYLFILGGYAFRRIGWLKPSADDSLLKLQIHVFYPALIFSFVFRNEALNQPSLLLLPPLVGFLSILLGFAVGYAIARMLGLCKGKGLRTFAFTTGIYNYGFIAIPLIDSLYHSKEVMGVLMVHNTGIEVAIWTLGILLLNGNITRHAWRKLINPPILALAAGLLMNRMLPGTVDADSTPLDAMFESVITTVQQLGRCAIPLALILIGASLRDLMHDASLKLDWRVVSGACLARLLVLPALFIAAALCLPLPMELQAVILIQAAMPSGMFPILMARHYGGSPQTAVQIVIATTLLSVVTIPLWIAIAQRLVG